MRYCPQEHELGASDNFCRQDGMEVRKCGHYKCEFGHPISIADRFCGECGIGVNMKDGGWPQPEPDCVAPAPTPLGIPKSAPDDRLFEKPKKNWLARFIEWMDS